MPIFSKIFDQAIILGSHFVHTSIVSKKFECPSCLQPRRLERKLVHIKSLSCDKLSLVTILAGLATITGVFLGLGSLPQAIKIFRTKSAKDIAPVSYVIVVLGSSIWILYGVELKSLPIMIPNILGVILGAIILVGWSRYGKPLKKNH